MAISQQKIDTFEIPISLWLILVGLSAQVQPAQVANSYLTPAHAVIETKTVLTGSSGGVNSYQSKRYYIPWVDIQPNLGVYSGTTPDSFSSVIFDPVNLIQTFIFKEVNI